MNSHMVCSKSWCYIYNTPGNYNCTAFYDATASPLASWERELLTGVTEPTYEIGFGKVTVHFPTGAWQKFDFVNIDDIRYNDKARTIVMDDKDENIFHVPSPEGTYWTVSY